MKVVWRPDASGLTRLIPRYSGQRYSYPEVGATQEGDLPPRYHHVTRSVLLGDDDEATFDRAAEALITWRMHQRAGLVVAASSDRVAADVTTVMAFGVSRAGIVIPCRVVWTADEPDRRGFAYGTLPGHPERGEEAFVVERANGRVMLSIRGFSAPGDRLVQAASGVARLMQTWTTNRYGRSLSDLSLA